MTRKRLAVVAAVGIMVCLPNLSASPQQANKPPVKRAIDKKPLTEEQKILHVLNRLGFGPRAGDVERVKKQGLKSYIEEQLNPEKIADKAVETKAAVFESLSLGGPEIATMERTVQMSNRQLQLLQNQLAQ